MRSDGRESDNVEDRRAGGPSGGGGMRLAGGGGIGVIILMLAAWFFGIDPSIVAGLAGGGAPAPQVQPQRGPSQPGAKPQDPQAKFVSVVLADTEDVWNKLFAQAGKKYVEPKLVLFRGSTPTACGTGQSAMGPFYCPADQKVYIDLSFYEELQRRFKAPGDFAQAYVIAHEVGHHIQHLLGISDRMEQMRRRVSEREYNQLSVRMELQADCLAGVWAHHAQKTRQILEQGDIEEAMRAAQAIGDDAIQRQSTGHIRPETFTHGSSAQRQKWFKQGLTSGRIDQCNTFEATNL
jgi:uncharacterized protein